MTQTASSRTVRAERARTQTFTTVGQWQLVRPVGEGQWTRVFQARPLGSPGSGPADYAVKILKTEFEEEPALQDLLRNEARIGRLVTHPHLVSVLASSVNESPFYVVTPFLTGMTLSELIKRRGSPSVPQALWYARQTAEALSALHARRVRHADVKPSNIFVSPQGHVTLIDLGFARPFGRINKSADSLVGTWAYAAPENFCENRGCGAPSDVYSLGVTLFELLTGRLPFDANDVSEFAERHMQIPPRDPRTLDPQLPPRVGRLIKNMLAKEPLRRPRITELVEVLVQLEIESFDER